MRYTTETMDKILTSETARDFLDQVAPIYGESKVALWLYQVMGMEWDEARRLCREFAQQVVPQTATWALDYWEQEYGIPRDPAMGMEQRRERILSYRRDRAPMNPYTLGRIASVAAANASATIEENTGKNQFTVWISAMPSDTDKAKITAAVKRAKPAHLNFDVKYDQYIQGILYAGGMTQLSYDLTARQV